MFLASYPRSGNTWLRAILFHARVGRAPESIAEIDRGVPDEHQKILKSSLYKEICGPENSFIVKTHEPNRFRAPYAHVAYIVRDPRDAIPSYYRYRNRGEGPGDGTLEEFSSACVRGCIWPCSWFEHVNSWMAFAERRPDCISVLRYETLVALDTSEIRKLGEALLIPEESDLAHLFGHYDLERMRNLEEKGNRSNEPATGFIGQGGASASQWEIPDQAIRREAAHWLPLMEELGYAI
jgi:hypothetical protein